MYHEKILSHYHAPQHYGLLESFDEEVSIENALCGDAVTVRLKFAGDCIHDSSFIHQGCVISRAAASMLMEYIQGKSKEEIRGLHLDFLIKNLLVSSITPARMPCVTLALAAVQRVV
ncbi:MAG: nitrogen fixation protein NifU [Parcubacteria group bacterium Gr01-1014_66]|nr:MAG: nitrogen fixation protein NifU [Parcubacteria group bacterium Gr01-1014_66]